MLVNNLFMALLFKAKCCIRPGWATYDYLYYSSLIFLSVSVPSIVPARQLGRYTTTYLDVIFSFLLAPTAHIQCDLLTWSVFDSYGHASYVAFCWDSIPTYPRIILPISYPRM